MIRRVAVLFAVAALAVASAETYKVRLFQPSVVQGTQLQPGNYKVEVKDSKVIIANGQTSVEAPVKVESAEKKFDSTTVRFAMEGGRYSIQEIRLGGTRTKLILNP